MRYATSTTVLIALAAVVTPAQEMTDGTTVRNGIPSCGPNRIATGINQATNLLLCSSAFIDDDGSDLTGERVDGPPAAPTAFPPSPEIRAAHGYTGGSMHWCGPNSFITGLSLATNRFNCALFVPGTRANYTATLGDLFLDYRASPTVRPGMPGMRACPVGSVLVGFHNVDGTLLCAQLPFCHVDADCSTGRICERLSIGSSSSDREGVCRLRSSTPGVATAGRITLHPKGGVNACTGNPDGSLSDRSGNSVNFTDAPNPGFDNDSADSILLNGIRAGTIIRVFDNSRGPPKTTISSR